MGKGRKQRNELWRIWESSPQPLYAVDDQRRIIFTNDAALRWLAVDLEQLAGAICNYHSRTDADRIQRLAAGLCPPPEAFLGQACQARRNDPGAAPASDEAPFQEVVIHFWPVQLDAGRWVVVAKAEPGQRKLPANGLTVEPADAPEALHQHIAAWRVQLAANYRLDRLVGVSPAMREVQRVARAAIESGAETAVIGRAGAGMESLARAIHYSQYRLGAAPPLIPFDCVVNDRESLHAALRQLQSDRDAASRGRLLLLHADRMNAEIMAELSGFVRLPQFDVGILSCGESSLKRLANEGSMEKVLAGYLSTIEIVMPALTDRLEDLPLLCQLILEDFNAEGNRQLQGFDAEALESLAQYPWPGDIEELARMVRMACLNAEGPRVAVDDLPRLISQGIAAIRYPRPVEEPIRLPSFLKEVEDELMRRALHLTKGNKAKAARMLGVSRQRMIRWAELRQPK